MPRMTFKAASCNGTGADVLTPSTLGEIVSLETTALLASVLFCSASCPALDRAGSSGPSVVFSWLGSVSSSEGRFSVNLCVIPSCSSSGSSTTGENPPLVSLLLLNPPRPFLLTSTRHSERRKPYDRVISRCNSLFRHPVDNPF